MSLTKTLTQSGAGFKVPWYPLGVGGAAALYGAARSRTGFPGGFPGAKLPWGRPRGGRATGSSAPNMMTAQHDAKTDYSKRRVGKRQRRRMRKRYKRKRRLVNTIRSSNVGTTHIVRRSLCLLTSGVGVSNSVSYGLYGLNGTGTDTFNTCNDIGEFFKEMDATSWAAVNNSAVQGQNHKIYSYHATAEYTIRNTGDKDVIIEAYYIRGRKGLNYAFAPNPTDAYFGGFNKQALATDPNTGNAFDTQLSATQIGVTPFQNSLWCRYYRVYKRQKFRIEPGAEVSFVLTDRRRRTFTMDQARTYATDRNYNGVLFQQQGPPDATGGVETPAIATAVTYMCSRRYRLKMFRDNLPKDAFETTDP